MKLEAIGVGNAAVALHDHVAEQVDVLVAEAHLLPGSDQRAVVEVGVGVVFVRGYGGPL